ncbi:hypothetical protein GCM10010435_08180 [Winogradskya consettensis]|uniref:Uncharacterized protein n=2 Tax=Winogradskya consettensis TaxID=113560 RepID=A0A919VYJ6_9ACTN|nr:hypothetical protein Aco04nite_70900 [Actinoplanes consettensis]
MYRLGLPTGQAVAEELGVTSLTPDFDRTSYLNQTSWSPVDGVRFPDGSPVNSIADFLRFAGVL